MKICIPWKSPPTSPFKISQPTISQTTSALKASLLKQLSEVLVNLELNMQLTRTVILQWSLKKWACSHAFDFIKIWCLWAEWSFWVHQFFEHSFVCQVLWRDMPAQSFTESGCACRYSNECTNSISHSHPLNVQALLDKICDAYYLPAWCSPSDYMELLKTLELKVRYELVCRFLLVYL